MSPPQRRVQRPALLLWAAIASYAVAFSALSILRQRAFNTGRFDLGNMVQAVWATAHGHPLRVTDLHGEQISRLAAHADPVLALYGPLWWIWPSPSLLLASQSALVALGALPVFWLARKHLASERGALGFALAYLLYPPVQWLTLNEFHPVALACPFLLFALWYLDEDRLLPFAVFAALAAFTKEEVPLVIAGFGVWYALARRRRLAGGLVALGGIAASAVAIGLIIPHFNNGQSSTFYQRYHEVGGSPGGVLKTALTHPLHVASVALDGRGVGYLLTMLIPLACLWLFAPLVAAAALPELAVNLLSATPTQTSIHFHYTAAEIPPFVGASVLGAGWIARRRPDRAAAIGVAAAAVALAANFHLGAIPLWRGLPHGEAFQSREHYVSRHDAVAAQALRRIPSRAVVSASNSLGAHLSARRRVLSFPVLRDAGWVALDETRPSYLDRNDALAAEVALVDLRQRPAWRLVFERDGILVFRRVR